MCSAWCIDSLCSVLPALCSRSITTGFRTIGFSFVPPLSLSCLTSTHVQWLLGSTIDAFMEWVLGQAMPLSASTDTLASHAVTPPHVIYVPAWVGAYMQTTRSLQKLISSPRMREAAYVQAVVAAAVKVTIVNVSNSHWVALKLDEASASVELYDPFPSAIATADSAQPFLRFLAGISRDDRYMHFTVHVLDRSLIPQLPLQEDSASCGIFAALYLYHYLMQARMHFSQGDVQRWRKFMLCKILSRASPPVVIDLLQDDD